MTRTLTKKTSAYPLRKRPLHIYIDARSGEQAGGGLRKYVQNLAELIVENGDIPYLIATKKLTFDIRGAQVCILPVKFHTVFWEQFQLPLFLHASSADVFHAPANMGIPMLLRKSAVLTIQDVIPLEITDFFAHAKVPVLSKVLYFLRMVTSISKARRVIVTTKVLQNSVAHFFGKTKSTTVIPLGVGEDYLQKHKSTQQSKEMYILNCGGVAERKNIDVLLQAFARFVTHKPAYKLYITGENEQLVPQLQLLAKKLKIADKVVWLGWVSDEKLEELMRAAQCIVYPSAAEGFGLPVLEALALKKPVVASDTLPIKDLLGDVPHYFSPCTPEALLQALRAATTNTDAKRLEHGRALASHYTWKRVVQSTYHEYSKAINT